METAQRKAWMERIRTLPDRAEEAVRGLDDRQLDSPYRPGGWTVRQLVHHLADAHMNAFMRVKLILTEENPILKTYDQDEWARLPDADRMPVQASLAILRGLHERWYALLQAIPDASFRRTGRHPERGEMTVDDLLALYARHGDTHLEQIRTFRSAQGW